MNDLLLAADPQTSHAELRRLVQSAGTEVLRCVAKNPNIPRDLVALLLRLYPDELVSNPAWQLLLLEDPNFLVREVSHFAISQMLGERKLPEVLVEYFAKHPSRYIRHRVAMYRKAEK